jgi:hypothetical protein
VTIHLAPAGYLAIWCAVHRVAFDEWLAAVAAGAPEKERTRLAEIVAVAALKKHDAQNRINQLTGVEP